MGISGPQDEQGQTPPMGSLSASDDAGTIDAPAGASFGRPARTSMPPSLAAGDMIGPYRVLSLLGEGGFGAVYRCESPGAVRREVAVKVLKMGMDTREVIARFAVERQTLAKMEHAGVARVLDAGATENGRPFFVMELVKGEGISAYCERKRLTIDERLSLFKDVCDAVQHAHHKGIIHRDLKPSNVLVMEVEGRPLPKVIDFGVAKAIDTSGDGDSKSLATQVGQLIGTPEYMSPEQATMSSLDLDTRTDIYSLGVILYQLLCGDLPTDPRTLRAASTFEVQRLLRERDPVKPSVKFTQLSEPEQDRVAQSRQTDAKELCRRLRGDLDWVTMKAVHKDRSMRYSSAAELASDVTRHLANLPVLASPPSFRYRFSKFAARNRGLVAGVALAVLAVVGTATALSVQAVRIAFERDRAVASERLAASRQLEAELAKQKAEMESAKSQQQTEFLRGMFAAVNPANARGTEYSVRELLDEAADKLDGSFQGQPELASSLRMIVGTSYLSLGKYDLALKQLTRAVEDRRTALGVDHPDTLDAENELGRVYERLSRPGEALPLLEHAYERRRAILGESADDTLATMNNLAVVYRAMDRLADAERLHRAVLAVRMDRPGLDFGTTLNSMFNLAQVLEDQGKSEEAAGYFRTTYERRLAVLGVDHPHTALSAYTYALTLQKRGKPAEAEPLMRSALEQRRKVLGPKHPETLESMRGMASVLLDLGRQDEALPLAQQAYDGFRAVVGAETVEALRAKGAIAVILLRQGKLAQAEVLFRELVDQQSALVGPGGSATLVAMNNLASTIERQGRAPEAVEIQQRVYDARVRTVGLLNPSTIVAGANLTSGLLKVGQTDRALTLAQETIASSLKIHGPDHTVTAVVRSYLGEALLAAGRPEDARRELADAYPRLSESSGPSHPRAVRVAKLLAGIEHAAGDQEQARLWDLRASEGATTAGTNPD
jgi:eukaryotic-like serine/threonine-protein kinase